MANNYRSREDAEQVIEFLETEEPSEMYSTLDIAVHPGYGLRNREHLEVENQRPEDYLRYSLELTRAIEDSDKSPFYVLNGGSREEVMNYLGEVEDSLNGFIDSFPARGFLTRQGKEDAAQAFAGLETGGTLRLHGELNGLCYNQFETLLSELKDLGKDFELREGHVYPEKPLERTAGRIHLEGETPRHLKLMESRTNH